MISHTKNLNLHNSYFTRQNSLQNNSAENVYNRIEEEEVSFDIKLILFGNI